MPNRTLAESIPAPVQKAQNGLTALRGPNAVIAPVTTKNRRNVMQASALHERSPPV
jgi:hypothetical protein